MMKMMFIEVLRVKYQYKMTQINCFTHLSLIKTFSFIIFPTLYLIKIQIMHFRRKKCSHVGSVPKIKIVHGK